MISVANATARLSAALGDGDAAYLAASALVEADALGLPRFGIDMLTEWKPGLAAPEDGINGPVEWRDCSDNFSPLAIAAATLGIERAAREFGLAAVFLKGVKGFGRLAPFARHLADQGLLAIAGAEGPPFVAPYGGNRPVIGTNPITLGFGTGDDRIVIDMATSTATMADVKTARLTGQPLGEGIAINSQGEPTTVASDVAALLPRGGQIGSLIGLMVEVLAGVAAKGRGDRNGRGVFLIAVDAGRMNGVDRLLAKLRRDWISAGGYWPRGGAVSPEMELDGNFENRLEAHIARITASNPGEGK
jgi:Malate/L-lactate dehydrogenases